MHATSTTTRTLTMVILALGTWGCGGDDGHSGFDSPGGGLEGTGASGGGAVTCAAPTCACSSCFETCVCQTGDVTSCTAACGDAPPGVGGSGAGGDGGSEPGVGGTSGAPTGGASGESGVAGTGGSPPGGSGGTGGIGGVAGQAGAATGGVSGQAGAAAGGVGGQAGAPANSGGVIPSAASCTGWGLTPTNDYGTQGPFVPVMVTGTGPTGQYTMFRPETLGQDGFVHPIATWGNGIFTRPEHYPGLLETFASHGFVIIASDSTNVNAALMTAGLDWLIAQNGVPGELQGRLATSCAVTIGYSLGGGAAVDAGSHPNVITTISWHGLQGTAERLHAPLFLLTSTNDGFVTKAGYVQPTYNRSSVVPTLMATLEVPGAVPDNAGHLIPLGNAGEEKAPAVAWLRFWVYGDEGARSWFYGPDCVLCRTPWVDLQRKNAVW